MLPPTIDISALCKQLFNIDSYSYQKRIFESAMCGSCRKITIRAATRAGKSFAMAEIAILRAVFEDNHKVGIIAPTHAKTRIIMNYVADLLASNTIFNDIVMLEVSGLSQLERLRKEVSKKRITFKNGSSIASLSVDLDSRGFGVMGFAFDTIIVDETDEIDDESYVKIYRMRVESKDSVIIEIGNPWRLAHFYTHHHDETWEKIHIPWQECVNAGRLSQEDVDDQRKNMTALEFRVLYDADFPSELENSIFSHEAIEKMTTPGTIAHPERILIGVDVARGGRDRTVITVMHAAGREAAYLIHKVMDTRDIMTIAGEVSEYVKASVPRHMKVEISVDAIGNGGGVKDRLSELGYDCQGFVAGHAAMDKTRFFNKKTEVAFRVAEAGKAGLIRNLPCASRYELELRAWTSQVRSDRQLKIVDPEEKSPDHADSLIIALSRFIYHESARTTAIDSTWRRGLETGRPRDVIRTRR